MWWYFSMNCAVLWIPMSAALTLECQLDAECRGSGCTWQLTPGICSSESTDSYGETRRTLVSLTIVDDHVAITARILTGRDSAKHDTRTTSELCRNCRENRRDRIIDRRPTKRRLEPLPLLSLLARIRSYTRAFTFHRVVYSVHCAWMNHWWSSAIYRLWVTKRITLVLVVGKRTRSPTKSLIALSSDSRDRSIRWAVRQAVRKAEENGAETWRGADRENRIKQEAKNRIIYKRERPLRNLLRLIRA